MLVVNDKNMVERRGVKTGFPGRHMMVIESGLSPDDWVIVEGLLQAIPGREVNPQRNPDAASAAGQTASSLEGSVSKFFIERPILANVIAIVTILLGVVCLYILPVAQYPDIVPPTIQVTTNYPGASAEVVATTVGIPIEQGGQRRRRLDLYAVHQRQRRQLYADRHLRRRHRSQRRHRAGAERGQQRAVATARGRCRPRA